MDEQQRRARELDALELIVEELEKMRMLREYELSAKVRTSQGCLYIEPVEEVAAGEGVRS